MKDFEQCLFKTFEKGGVSQIQCCGLVPGPGHVYCTFIEGSQKAMLIDNGFGYDDFIPYLKSLTDKEIIYAATHVHPDHMGGARNFDKIYVSEKDFRNFDELGMNFDPINMTLSGKTKIIPLEDGHVFDLGDRKVTAIATPGHTWGSTCFYDSRAGIMIAGDTLNRHIFLQCAKPAVPLKMYLQGLNHLLDYDFDMFLGGHHPEPFAREWIYKMIDFVSHFNPDRGKPYGRDGFPESIYIYSRGRGYGDPDYIAIIYDSNDLLELMS